MFFQFKSETLFRLKLISDSIQVKLCQIEKKKSDTTEKASPIPGLLSCKALGTVWHYQLWSLKHKSETT